MLPVAPPESPSLSVPCPLRTDVEVSSFSGEVLARLSFEDAAVTAGAVRAALGLSLPDDCVRAELLSQEGRRLGDDEPIAEPRVSLTAVLSHQVPDASLREFRRGRPMGEDSEMNPIYEAAYLSLSLSLCCVSGERLGLGGHAPLRCPDGSLRSHFWLTDGVLERVSNQHTRGVYHWDALQIVSQCVECRFGGLQQAARALRSARCGRWRQGRGLAASEAPNRWVNARAPDAEQGRAARQPAFCRAGRPSESCAECFLVLRKSCPTACACCKLHLEHALRTSPIEPPHQRGRRCPDSLKSAQAQAQIRSRGAGIASR